MLAHQPIEAIRQGGRTSHPWRIRTHGVTLFELLIVLGIIVLLAALLFPTLSRIRRQANRVNDLANIRSFAQVCLLYASDNDNYWPLGQRENASPTANDDLGWMRYSTTQILMKVYGLKKQGLCCNTEWDARGFATLTTQQNGPNAGTFIGWLYLANRTGSNGVVQYPSLQPYVIPTRVNRAGTSRTLATCWHYVPGGNSWDGPLPHYGSSESMVLVPSGTLPDSPLVNEFRGLCVAYMDGSARWCPREELSILRDVDYHWYDPLK